MVIKEKKWGFWKGLSGRVKMILQMIKIRLNICIKKQRKKTG